MPTEGLCFFVFFFTGTFLLTAQELSKIGPVGRSPPVCWVIGTLHGTLDASEQERWLRFSWCLYTVRNTWRLVPYIVTSEDKWQREIRKLPSTSHKRGRSHHKRLLLPLCLVSRHWTQAQAECQTQDLNEARNWPFLLGGVWWSIRLWWHSCLPER